MSGVTVTQNGVAVSYKLSDDHASVSFSTTDTAPSIVSGLRPGIYELKETVTPEGYLTADSIVFILYDDGTYTDSGISVTVAGSPIVMVDKADPSYKGNPDTDIISDHDIDNHHDNNPIINPDNYRNPDDGKKPDDNNNPKPDDNKSKTNSGSPIPATGEQISYYAVAGVMLISLCGAIITGLGFFRKKESDR